MYNDFSRRLTTAIISQQFQTGIEIHRIWVHINNLFADQPVNLLKVNNSHVFHISLT